MLQKQQKANAQEDLVRSLSRDIAILKASIAQILPDDEIAEGLAHAFESLRTGEISQQLLVEGILSDENSFSATSYIAALTLAKWSARPDVVLPYMGRLLEWFFEAGLPEESHELMKEMFAGALLYGRVRTNEFSENNGIMTSLHFHESGEFGNRYSK